MSGTPELFRVIDWLLRLPDELAKEFKTRLAKFEEEGRVVYITQGEEIALKQGRQEGRLEVLQSLQKAVLTLLEVKFGAVPEELTARVRSTRDVATLDALVQRAAAVTSPGELFNGDAPSS